jgi:hypothetical protein
MNYLIDRDLPTWKINDPTKVSEFMTCNRKYLYQYILGWRPEAPSNHLVFGTSWHIAMEYLLTHDYSTRSVVRAHDAMVSDYRKTFGPETDEMFWPKTPNNALLVLNAYASKFSTDLTLWTPKYTEIAGKIHISDNQILHFRMDSIMEHREKGKVKSIEHKTGSNTWNWELQWPLSMQNGTYSHVLYCLYPSELVEGIVFRGSFFKKAKTAWAKLTAGEGIGKLQPPYDFIEFPGAKSLDQMQTWLWGTSYWLDRLTEEFELLSDATENDEVLMAFPLNPTACTRWFGCEYLDYCQAWQNPLRRCYEPPLGFKEDHWDPSARPAKKTFELGVTKNE